MYTNEKLEELTLKWGDARYITINGKIPTQVLKLVEEFNLEYYEAVSENDIDKLKDSIGDSVVVCTMINGLLDRKFTSLTADDVLCQAVSGLNKRDRLDYILSSININLGRLAANSIRNKNDELCENIDALFSSFEMLANTHNLDINECWNLAYKEIQYRTGFLNEQGNFIKDE